MIRPGRGVLGGLVRGRGLLRKSCFAWDTTGPGIGGRRNLVRLAQYGSQIASNSAGVDHY